MTSKVLKLPGMRGCIKICFERLADEESQTKWFDSDYKHAFWDSLDHYVFDFLFNDVFLLDEAEKAIGQTLYNKDEADTISKYLNFYNDTFEGEMPDSYYIQHLQWPNVLEGARKIVEMMETNNIKYNFAHNAKTSNYLEPYSTI